MVKKQTKDENIFDGKTNNIKSLRTIVPVVYLDDFTINLIDSDNLMEKKDENIFDELNNNKKSLTHQRPSQKSPCAVFWWRFRH